MEKRNEIQMLWQPEQSQRQLKQVVGDSKDIFFPDNNSMSKLLSFKKEKNQKALHTHCQGKQMISDSLYR